MATFPTPSQLAQSYFQILKSIKPSLNVNDVNSDFVIRGNTFSGIASGYTGDTQKVYNDTFISSARIEALQLKGQDYGIAQQPATTAKSTGVQILGPNGVTVAPGDLTFLYAPTNVLYTNTTGGTISGGALLVTAECEISGQVGNIKATDVLTVVSPPSGINPVANLTTDMADGADQESTDSYRARLLSHLQNPPAGGNETDYPQFAFDADATVRSAFIRRFGRGLGTVDIYVTTGTTDIDTAVTNGTAIVRIPSAPTIAAIQAYYDAHVPLTDCPEVYAPTELSVPVTVNVALAAGLTMTSVPSDPTYNPLGLNIQALVQREVSRVLYKYNVGGRTVSGSTGGFIVASDIEAGLDTWLSAVKDPVTGLLKGKIPVLDDRQVQKLNGTSWDLPVASNQLAAPGAISVVNGGL